MRVMGSSEECRRKNAQGRRKEEEGWHPVAQAPRVPAPAGETEGQALHGLRLALLLSGDLTFSTHRSYHDECCFLALRAFLQG